MRSLPIAIAAAIAVATFASGCSIGDGTGSVIGTINAPDCWTGKFDLRPNFFVADPYRNTLQLRIQRGSDYQTFSDGLSILIDDVAAIRGTDETPSLYNKPLPVGMPPAVMPAGVPIQVVKDPAIIHAALYLQRSCSSQNITLYASDVVSLAEDGSCDGPLPTEEERRRECAAAPGGRAPKTARSTMTFAQLFNGNPEEASAAKRLNDASYDLYLADPREVCPGGIGPPPRCRGHLTGSFHFYFERGRPAQPFP